MTRLRAVRVSFVAAACAAAFAACQSSEPSSTKRTARPFELDASPQNEAGTVIIQRDAEPSDDGAVVTPVIERGALADAGEVVLPDTDCGVGPVGEVLSGAANSSGPIAATFAVGARRALELTGGEGALIVDLDGGNALAAPLKLDGLGNRAASQGSKLALASAFGGEVKVARYDDMGQPVGSTLVAATGQTVQGVMAAAGDNHALVAWAVDGAVRGRTLDDGAFVGNAFDIASSATLYFQGAAVYDGAGGFGIVWSGASGPSAYEMRFAHVKAGATDVPALELGTSSSAFGVAHLARIPNGYALLYNAPGGVVRLALLGNDGKPTAATRVVGGASLGFAVGVNGDKLALVARHDGAVALRPLSATGTPAGDWVCYEGASTDPDQRAAIDADDTGFALVYRSPSKDQKLVRIDALGAAR